jgi:hypothetical protein
MRVDIFQIATLAGYLLDFPAFARVIIWLSDFCDDSRFRVPNLDGRKSSLDFQILSKCDTLTYGNREDDAKNCQQNESRTPWHVEGPKRIGSCHLQ